MRAESGWYDNTLNPGSRLNVRKSYDREGSVVIDSDQPSIRLAEADVRRLRDQLNELLGDAPSPEPAALSVGQLKVDVRLMLGDRDVTELLAGQVTA